MPWWASVTLLGLYFHVWARHQSLFISMVWVIYQRSNLNPRVVVQNYILKIKIPNSDYLTHFEYVLRVALVRGWWWWWLLLWGYYLVMNDGPEHLSFSFQGKKSHAHHALLINYQTYLLSLLNAFQIYFAFPKQKKFKIYIKVILRKRVWLNKIIYSRHCHFIYLFFMTPT